MNAKTLRASLLAVTTAIALCAAIVPLAAHAYDENSTAAIAAANSCSSCAPWRPTCPPGWTCTS